MDEPLTVLSTLNADGSRRWLNPKPSYGATWRARMWVGWSLIALFGILPWVNIGGAPAVLLHLGTRRFYVLGARFAPSDTVALMVIVLIGLLSVFLVTALVGRAWCGWACPQTVYLELVFRPVDRLLGKRGSLGKHMPQVVAGSLRAGVYLAGSLYLAHTFLAYFVGVDALASWLNQSPTAHPVAFLVMATTTGLILFNYGYFREQMCTVACPYARLQSVLLDKDSLVVGYDVLRGEPRTKPAAKQAPESAAGDCVDCGACVRTCPTGIDIRAGLQLECVACAQCVDACDAIMVRVGKPTGLIRYASQRQLEDRVPTRLWRFRPLVYAGLLIVIAGLGLVWMAKRSPLEVFVVRDGGGLFEVLPSGDVVNHLKLRVTNLADADMDFEVHAQGIGQVQSSELPLHVGASLRREARFALQAPAHVFSHGTYSLVLEVRGHNVVQEVQYRMVGPKDEGAR